MIAQFKLHKTSFMTFSAVEFSIYKTIEGLRKAIKWSWKINVKSTGGDKMEANQEEGRLFFAIVALHHTSHIECFILNKQIRLFTKKDKLGVWRSAIMSNTESWEMGAGVGGTESLTPEREQRWKSFL